MSHNPDDSRGVKTMPNSLREAFGSKYKYRKRAAEDPSQATAAEIPGAPTSVRIQWTECNRLSRRSAVSMSYWAWEGVWTSSR
jgi:hypothetical protein